MSEGRTSPIAPPRPEISQPQPPFDNEDADVILRSSDEVDFRVFKLILSLSSSFFKDTFSLPQAPDLSKGADIQVVEILEDSHVLDKLLRFCYPCEDPVVKTLDEIHAVIEAMMKYDMLEVVKRAKQVLRSFAKSHPVAVFAISCRYEWEDLARTAARAALAVPLRKFDTKSAVKELLTLRAST
ncbi:hypothetical protein B0H11DRAFT_1989394 [Mycena galericulata]|nr:hypothetical protein B0H11DRAFT_1989394 [Mycena galericulata]